MDQKKRRMGSICRGSLGKLQMQTRAATIKMNRRPEAVSEFSLAEPKHSAIKAQDATIRESMNTALSIFVCVGDVYNLYT